MRIAMVRWAKKSYFFFILCISRVVGTL